MQIEATPSPHEYSAPNRTISTRAPGHVTKADGVATGFETVDDKGSIGDTDPRPPCIMGGGSPAAPTSPGGSGGPGVGVAGRRHGGKGCAARAGQNGRSSGWW